MRHRIIVAIVIVAAAFGLTLTTSAGASIHLRPDTTAQMCESSGHGYCMVSSGGQQFLTTSGNGTPMNWHPNGGTFLYNGQVYNIGTINEPSISPACLGTASNGTRITNQNCDTGNGIIWAEGFDSSGHTVWLNRKAIQDGGNQAEWVLAASDGLDSPLFLSTFPPGSGIFERWIFN